MIHLVVSEVGYSFLFEQLNSPLYPLVVIPTDEETQNIEGQASDSELGQLLHYISMAHLMLLKRHLSHA